MKYYQADFTIDAPHELMASARDVLAAMAGEAGFESFQDSTEGIVGYVQQQLLDRDALDALVALFPLEQCHVGYELHEAEYCDWNEQWEQQGFEPITAGRFIVHDGRHSPLATQPYSNKGCVDIEIHARQAFGTGTHETTQMMLAVLSGLQLEGKRVLDCGTGTGILAIAALKGGAKEAVGYDIDEWSTDNARHNAETNGVGDRMTVMLGDATVMDALEAPFDVVLANINRNILLADMPAMAAVMTPGALLALSGFLADDVPLLAERAAALGLRMADRQQEGQWCCITLLK